MILALVAWVALTVVPARAAIGVSDLTGSTTATALANALAGPGIAVSNVTYTGDNQAAGLITGGSGIIGFGSGIVLSSGKAVDVVGPNNSAGKTTAFSTAGDANLSTLSGFTTFDAAVLEFDFVPTSNQIKFDYVFSSEEYNEYVNSDFNDVFGFFVNGTNCAVVGSPPVPVTINTINNGNPFGTTPNSHPSLFVNNEDAHLDTQMDGLTVVLTCQANVNANASNHMKLAIADASDRVLDSAVFLKENSLTSVLTLAKSADKQTYSAVGDTITYTYTITNAGGNSFAGPFSISDDKEGTISPCGSGPLAPGASTSCTKTHTITQADIDAGSITNKATATGNSVTSNQATATVTFSGGPPPQKALSLSKGASPSTYSAVGDTITYTYTITNSGATTLDGPFSVSDDKEGTISPCGSGPLNAGASTSCTATHTISQADIDAGSITNKATASGNDVTSNQASATVTLATTQTTTTTTETTGTTTETTVTTTDTTTETTGTVTETTGTVTETTGTVTETTGTVTETTGTTTETTGTTTTTSGSVSETTSSQSESTSTHTLPPTDAATPGSPTSTIFSFLLLLLAVGSLVLAMAGPRAARRQVRR